MKYNYSAIKRMKNKEQKLTAFGQLIEKRTNNARPAKPIPSLQDDYHIMQKDYDCWTEYGFFEVGDMTDEEIQEHIDDMYIKICSPYDCTGKVFTQCISWHRNPCGWISVIHYKALDV